MGISVLHLPPSPVLIAPFLFLSPPHPDRDSIFPSPIPIPVFPPIPIPPAMGCNVRDKSLRGSRKPRYSAKQQQPTAGDPNPPNPVVTSTAKVTSSTADSTPNPTADPSANTCSVKGDLSNLQSLDVYDQEAVAATGEAMLESGYCTEAQLEELLLRNLDYVYKEALSGLLGLGYDEEVALRAILRNGHCYGTMDVLSNILHNAVGYINSMATNNADSDDVPSAAGEPAVVAATAAPPYHAAVFSDLRHLEEYSLAGMVCLLQEVRPHLSRGDAMWCLLMSELHVGRASTMEIPVVSQPLPQSSASSPSFSVGTESGEVGCPVAYGACRFHDGCGGEKEIDPTKLLNLSPAMKNFYKRNAALPAAGFRLNSKLSLPAALTRADLSLFSSSSCSDNQSQNQSQKSHDGDTAGKDTDVVGSVLKSLENMSLEEKGQESAEDPRNEMILNLVNQIRELEEQLKDRKEWAQQKAMQAARKLSTDMMELKELRMEREENQRLKKGKHTLEDSTMKRLSEMENALRKASGQVDRANAAVRQLETENAEIRAEMEASKLSNAESEKMCLDISKREKKYLKKVLAREKQKEKMEAELAEGRKKILLIQQKLSDVSGAQKEAEGKMREKIKAKEQAIALVEEERRTKEAAEASIKRKYEALRQKNEIDLQRHKDDIQRLEDELSRLRSSSLSSHSNCISSNIFSPGDANRTKSSNELNGKTIHRSQKPLESSHKKVNRDRECLICNKNEVSVVFLPCAHQVLCANCNQSHEKRRKTCPCCVAHIEQRIRVYGASS